MSNQYIKFEKNQNMYIMHKFFFLIHKAHLKCVLGYAEYVALEYVAQLAGIVS